ncbi:thiolase family protein [Nocardia sp. NPDC005366]|uniref:thiolase family protein n=1 Tax=Nocardia sp. NPDC005366 TaxID=3156878 RepID=UPI0033B0BDD5
MNTPIPFTFQIVEAVNAVFAGAADVVLAYHATRRAGGTSRSALADPYRLRAGLGGNRPAHTPDTIAGAVGYAAWTSRYIHQYNVSKEAFGRIAINGRTNAANNPQAALQTPLTMDEYLSARLVREPLSILDMDYPVDAADALVITTAERAADMEAPAVLVHTANSGMTAHPDEDQLEDLDHTGQQVVLDRLWRTSDLKLEDIDVFFPYDGFSTLALRWIETVGFCGPGEAGDFLASHWDHDRNRVLINGRIPINTHGGSLSGGGTQGSGHVREAVLQLQGRAGARQVQGARSALVTPGGFFFNAGGIILRVAQDGR